MTTKTFNSTDTNTQAFYDILHKQGVKDDEIDGAALAKTGADPAKPQDPGKKDGKISQQEVVAFVCNNFTKYQSSIQEHFKKLGVDISWIKPDGTIDEEKKKQVMAKLNANGFAAIHNNVPKGEMPKKGDAVSPFISDYIVGAAAKNPEFGLLSITDQEAVLVDYLKTQDLDANQIKTMTSEIKQALADPKRFPTPDKKIATAALLQGRDLLAQARERAAAGDAKGAKTALNQAKKVFTASMEMNPTDHEAPLELAQALVDGGDKKGAKEIVDRLLSGATGTSHYDRLDKIQAFLTKPENIDLLPPGQNAWAYIGDTVSGGVKVNTDDRLELAKYCYNRGWNEAKLAKNEPLMKELSEKNERIQEFKVPFTTSFGPPLGEKDPVNPAAYSFYKALKAQGVTDHGMDQGADAKTKEGFFHITNEEVFGYISKNLDDPRVKNVLEQAHIQLNDDDKKQIKEKGFAKFMADRFTKEAGVIESGKDWRTPEKLQERGQLLLFAHYFEPNNPDRLEAMGWVFISGNDTVTGLKTFQSALEINPDHHVKVNADTVYDNFIRESQEKVDKLGVEGNYKAQEPILRQMLEASAIYDKIYPERASSPKHLRERGMMLYELGLTLKKTGRQDQAREIFQQSLATYQSAIMANKNDAAFCIAVYNEKGDAAMAMGEYFEANKAFMLSAQCQKLRVQYDPTDESAQEPDFKTVKFQRTPTMPDRRFKKYGGQITNPTLGGKDVPLGNYIDHKVHDIESSEGMDAIPSAINVLEGDMVRTFTVGRDLAGMDGKLEDLLTKHKGERETLSKPLVPPEGELTPAQRELFDKLPPAEKKVFIEKKASERRQALFESMEEDGKILGFLGREAEAKALGEEASKLKEQVTLDKNLARVGLAQNQGLVSAEGLKTVADRENKDQPTALEFSKYVTFTPKQGGGFKAELNADFEALPIGDKIRVTKALIASAERTQISNLSAKAPAEAKGYYEAELARFDGDEAKAKEKFKAFVEANKDTKDEAIKPLVLRAATYLEGKKPVEGQDPQTTILNNTRVLLGPMMMTLKSDAEGGIDLSSISKESITSFGEFRDYLAAQTAVDGMAFSQNPFPSIDMSFKSKNFNFVLFSNYQKVLSNPKHEKLLRLLYQQFDPDKGGADAPKVSPEELGKLYRDFQNDMIRVSESRFVSNNLGTAAGRERLKAILNDPEVEDGVKADLMEEIVGQGHDRKYLGDGKYLRFQKYISTWGIDFGTTHDEVVKARVIAIEALDNASLMESNRKSQVEDYKLFPQDVQRLHAHNLDKEITPSDIRAMATMVEECGAKTGGVEHMKAKLGTFWLTIVDNENWEAQSMSYTHIPAEKRAEWANGIQALLKEADGIRTEDEFKAWNIRIGTFLRGHPYSLGKAAKEELGVVGWAIDKVPGTAIADEVIKIGKSAADGVGNELGIYTLAGAMGKMRPDLGQPFNDLLKFSDEFQAAANNDLDVAAFDPDVAVTDEKLQGKARQSIQELRGWQRSFWYQYEQRCFLSRNAVGSYPDIQKFKAANKEIDGLIADLKVAKTPQEFEAIKKRLTDATKKGGAIHSGFVAAEMDGVEQVKNLVQIILEMIAIEVVTGGAGTGVAIGRGMAEGAAALRRTRSVAEAFRVFKETKSAVQMARMAELAEVADVARFGSSLANMTTKEAEVLRGLEAGKFRLLENGSVVMKSGMKEAELLEGMKSGKLAKEFTLLEDGSIVVKNMPEIRVLAKDAGEMALKEVDWINTAGKAAKPQNFLSKGLNKLAGSGSETFGARAAKGFKTGFTMSLTNEVLEDMSGQLKAEPETVLDWLYRATATGLSMAVTGGLHAAHPEELQKGMLEACRYRWLTQGPKGAMNFLKDTGMEVLEEVIDNYTQKVLKRDWKALSWDEFRDITVICFAGGVKQNLWSRMVNLPKQYSATKEAKAIQGFRVNGEKIVYDQKLGYVRVDSQDGFLGKADKTELQAFMAYQSTLPVDDKQKSSVRVLQFDAAEKGAKGKPVLTSLEDIPKVGSDSKKGAGDAKVEGGKAAPVKSQQEVYAEKKREALFNEFHDKGHRVVFEDEKRQLGLLVVDANGKKVRQGTVDEQQAFQEYDDLTKGVAAKTLKVVGTPSQGFQVVDADGKFVRDAKPYEYQIQEKILAQQVVDGAKKLAAAKGEDAAADVSPLPDSGKVPVASRDFRKGAVLVGPDGSLTSIDVTAGNPAEVTLEGGARLEIATTEEGKQFVKAKAGTVEIQKAGEDTWTTLPAEGLALNPHDKIKVDGKEFTFRPALELLPGGKKSGPPELPTVRVKKAHDAVMGSPDGNTKGLAETFGANDTFNDAARAFMKRAQDNPQMDVAAEAKRMGEVLNHLKENVVGKADNLSPEARQALTETLFRQVMSGDMTLAEAKALGAQLATGTVHIEALAPGDMNGAKYPYRIADGKAAAYDGKEPTITVHDLQYQTYYNHLTTNDPSAANDPQVKAALEAFLKELNPRKDYASVVNGLQDGTMLLTLLDGKIHLQTSADVKARIETARDLAGKVMQEKGVTKIDKKSLETFLTAVARDPNLTPAQIEARLNATMDALAVLAPELRKMPKEARGPILESVVRQVAEGKIEAKEIERALGKGLSEARTAELESQLGVPKGKWLSDLLAKDGAGFKERLRVIDATRARAGEIVQKMTAGADRAQVKAEILESLKTEGINISTDTAKAVDSMIDMSLIANQAGIVDMPGGLSQDQLVGLMTTLYLQNSPTLRIGDSELTHVPMVVKGTLDFLLAQKPDATVSERRVAFVTALFHDAGKFEKENLRTSQGFTVVSNSFMNNTGIDLAIRPNETLQEGVTRLSQDPATLQAIMKKNPQIKSEAEAAKLLQGLPLLKGPAFLVGMIAHHDAAGVHDAISKNLVKQGILSEKESMEVWRAIERHALVSSWIDNNSVGGVGVLTEVFKNPEHAEFLNLYIKGWNVGDTKVKGIAGLMADGTLKFDEKSGQFKIADPSKLDPAVAKSIEDNVARLQEIFANPENAKAGFSILDRAMLLGDHQGQMDIAKYMTILVNSPANKDASIHQILLGGDRTNSVDGVLATHTDEQRMLMPKEGQAASKAFQRADGWLREMDPAKPGLAKALMDDPKTKEAFDTWKKTNPDGNVEGWLKSLKAKDEKGQVTQTFKDVQGAIEKGFYNHYNLDAKSKAEYDWAPKAPEVLDLTDEAKLIEPPPVPLPRFPLESEVKVDEQGKVTHPPQTAVDDKPLPRFRLPDEEGEGVMPGVKYSDAQGNLWKTPERAKAWSKLTGDFQGHYMPVTPADYVFAFNEANGKPPSQADIDFFTRKFAGKFIDKFGHPQANLLHRNLVNSFGSLEAVPKMPDFQTGQNTLFGMIQNPKYAYDYEAQRNLVMAMKYQFGNDPQYVQQLRSMEDFSRIAQGHEDKANRSFDRGTTVEVRMEGGKVVYIQHTVMNINGQMITHPISVGAEHYYAFLRYQEKFIPLPSFELDESPPPADAKPGVKYPDKDGNFWNSLERANTWSHLMDKHGDLAKPLTTEEYQAAWKAANDGKEAPAGDVEYFNRKFNGKYVDASGHVLHVAPPAFMAREGSPAGILLGGGSVVGQGSLIPKDGSIKRAAKGVEMRFNAQSGNYEYRTEAVPNWKAVPVGGRIVNGHESFVFAELRGSPKDMGDAMKDGYAQFRYQMATAGVEQHLNRLQTSGRPASTVDKGNLSLFFSEDFQQAQRAHDGGDAERKRGGLYGGTTQTYAYVDPRTGQILTFAKRDFDPKESVRGELWSLQRNAKGDYEWVNDDKSNPKTQPLDRKGVPPGAVIVPITVTRMTGQLQVDPEALGLKGALSETAVQRLQNLNGFVGEVPSTLVGTVARYHDGEARNLEPAPKPAKPVGPENTEIIPIDPNQAAAKPPLTDDDATGAVKMPVGPPVLDFVGEYLDGQEPWVKDIAYLANLDADNKAKGVTMAPDEQAQIDAALKGKGAAEHLMGVMGEIRSQEIILKSIPDTAENQGKRTEIKTRLETLRTEEKADQELIGKWRTYSADRNEVMKNRRETTVPLEVRAARWDGFEKGFLPEAPDGPVILDVSYTEPKFGADLETGPGNTDGGYNTILHVRDVKDQTQLLNEIGANPGKNKAELVEDSDGVVRSIKFTTPEGKTFRVRVEVAALENQTRGVDRDGIATGSHDGVNYKKGQVRQEDQVSVTAFADGRTVTFMIDGMGGHEGGREAAVRAKQGFEAAIAQGKNVDEAILAADAAVKKFNDDLVESRKATGVKGDSAKKGLPGAVGITSEVIPVRNDKGEVVSYDANFRWVGDAEAVVISFDDKGEPVIQDAMGRSEEDIRKERTNPHANIVSQAFGGHYGKDGLKVHSNTITGLKPGAFLLSGSDGFFENFGSHAEIARIIKDSGAKTPAEARNALMREVLIQQKFIQIQGAHGWQPIELSHERYAEAYEAVTGQKPPEGWKGRHEGLWLDARGNVGEKSALVETDLDGYKVTLLKPEEMKTHFKKDNTTLSVQKLGEPVAGLAPKAKGPVALAPGSPELANYQAEHKQEIEALIRKFAPELIKGLPDNEAKAVLEAFTVQVTKLAAEDFQGLPFDAQNHGAESKFVVNRQTQIETLAKKFGLQNNPDFMNAMETALVDDVLLKAPRVTAEAKPGKSVEQMGAALQMQVFNELSASALRQQRLGGVQEIGLARDQIDNLMKIAGNVRSDFETQMKAGKPFAEARSQALKRIGLNEDDLPGADAPAFANTPSEGSKEVTGTSKETPGAKKPGPGNTKVTKSYTPSQPGKGDGDVTKSYTPSKPGKTGDDEVTKTYTPAKPAASAKPLPQDFVRSQFVGSQQLTKVAGMEGNAQFRQDLAKLIIGDVHREGVPENATREETIKIRAQAAKAFAEKYGLSGNTEFMKGLAQQTVTNVNTAHANNFPRLAPADVQTRTDVLALTPTAPEKPVTPQDFIREQYAKARLLGKSVGMDGNTEFNQDLAKLVIGDVHRDGIRADATPEEVLKFRVSQAKAFAAKYGLSENVDFMKGLAQLTVANLKAAQTYDFPRITENELAYRQEKLADNKPNQALPPPPMPGLTDVVIPKDGAVPHKNTERRAMVATELLERVWPDKDGRPGFQQVLFLEELEYMPETLNEKGHPILAQQIARDLNTVMEAPAHSPEYDAALARLAKVIDTRRSNYRDDLMFMDGPTLQRFTDEAGGIMKQGEARERFVGLNAELKAFDEAAQAKQDGKELTADQKALLEDTTLQAKVDERAKLLEANPDFQPPAVEAPPPTPQEFIRGQFFAARELGKAVGMEGNAEFNQDLAKLIIGDVHRDGVRADAPNREVLTVRINAAKAFAAKYGLSGNVDFMKALAQLTVANLKAAQKFDFPRITQSELDYRSDKLAGNKPNQALPPAPKPGSGEVVIPKQGAIPSLDIERRAAVTTGLMEEVWHESAGQHDFLKDKFLETLENLPKALEEKGQKELAERISRDLHTVMEAALDSPEYKAALERLGDVADLRRKLPADFKDLTPDAVQKFADAAVEALKTGDIKEEYARMNADLKAFDEAAQLKKDGKELNADQKKLLEDPELIKKDQARQKFAQENRVALNLLPDTVPPPPRPKRKAFSGSPTTQKLFGNVGKALELKLSAGLPSGAQVSEVAARGSNPKDIAKSIADQVPPELRGKDRYVMVHIEGPNGKHHFIVDTYDNLTSPAQLSFMMDGTARSKTLQIDFEVTQKNPGDPPRVLLAFIGASPDLRKSRASTAAFDGMIAFFKDRYPGGTVEMQASNVVSALLLNRNVSGLNVMTVTDPDHTHLQRTLEPDFVKACVASGAISPAAGEALLKDIEGVQADLKSHREQLDGMVQAGLLTQGQADARAQEQMDPKKAQAIHNRFQQELRKAFDAAKNDPNNPTQASGEVDFLLQKLKASGALETMRSNPYQGDIWVEGKMDGEWKAELHEEPVAEPPPSSKSPPSGPQGGFDDWSDVNPVEHGPLSLDPKITNVPPDTLVATLRPEDLPPMTQAKAISSDPKALDDAMAATMAPSALADTVQPDAIQQPVSFKELAPASQQSALQKSGLSFVLQDGYLGVKGKGDIVVNGKTVPGGQFIALNEGDTVLVGEQYFARTNGQLRPIEGTTANAELLGAGGMGKIYDNKNGTVTKTPKAVQVYRNGHLETLNSLDVEQRALAYVHDLGAQDPELRDFAPNLVGRTAPGELVMDKVPGESISSLARKDGKAPEIPSVAWDAFEAKLRKLRDAGLSHGDINPDNIMWDGKTLRIVDFGEARIGVKSEADILRFQRIRDAYQKAAKDGKDPSSTIFLSMASDFAADRTFVPYDFPFVPKPDATVISITARPGKLKAKPPANQNDDNAPPVTQRSHRGDVDPAALDTKGGAAPKVYFVEPDPNAPPPSNPPPLKALAFEPGKGPVMVTQKGEFFALNFGDGTTGTFPLGAQDASINRQQDGSYQLNFAENQDFSYQVYDAQTQKWTTYSAKEHPNVTLAEGSKVKIGDDEITWYPSGESKEAQQRISDPILTTDLRLRVNAPAEAMDNGTAQAALGNWAVTNPKEYAAFLMGNGILTLTADGKIVREADPDVIRQRVTQATQAGMELAKAQGYENGKAKPILEAIAKQAAMDPDLNTPEKINAFAQKIFNEMAGPATKASPTETPPPAFNMSSLHPSKQAKVNAWLGGRSLDSLTTTEQDMLVKHLLNLQGKEKWSKGDIQKLISPEGMKYFLAYGKDLPFGFETRDQWNKFQKNLMEQLLAAGVPIHDPRVKIVLTGSSVRGRSHDLDGTKKAMKDAPYKWQPDIKNPNKAMRVASDLDIAIMVDGELFETFIDRREKARVEAGQPTGADDKDLRRIRYEKKLTYTHFDPVLTKARTNVQSTIARPVHLAILPPDSKYIPTPDNVMVLSADILATGT